MNTFIMIVLGLPIYMFFAWRFVAAWKSYQEATRDFVNSPLPYLISSAETFTALSPVLIVLLWPPPFFMLFLSIAMGVLGLWNFYWWYRFRVFQNSRAQTSDIIKSRILTVFQEKCEAALRSALKADGREITGRQLAGESETYIRASVSDTDIVVYIYKDEAQYHRGSQLEGLFEHQDFRDPQQLQEAFVHGVVTAVKKRP